MVVHMVLWVMPFEEDTWTDVDAFSPGVHGVVKGGPLAILVVPFSGPSGRNMSGVRGCRVCHDPIQAVGGLAFAAPKQLLGFFTWPSREGSRGRL